MVSLNYCKEYLTGEIKNNSILTLDKELNILIYGLPFYVIIYRCYKL